MINDLNVGRTHSAVFCETLLHTKMIRSASASIQCGGTVKQQVIASVVTDTDTG